MRRLSDELEGVKEELEEMGEVMELVLADEEDLGGESWAAAAVGGGGGGEGGGEGAKRDWRDGSGDDGGDGLAGKQGKMMLKGVFSPRGQ